MVNGAPCVMISGILLMVWWFVDNWDLMMLVNYATDTMHAAIAYERLYISVYIYMSLTAYITLHYRKHYYHHRDLGQRQTRGCISIIVDGMDQSKTNLPHLIRERKSGSNLWRLRCVLCVLVRMHVCVIVHV